MVVPRNRSPNDYLRIQCDMSKQPAKQLGESDPAAARRRQAAHLMEWTAIAILLACLCARCFVGEMPFRGMLHISAVLAGNEHISASSLVDWTELSRVVFSMLLWLALVLAAAAARTLCRPLAHRWLLVPLIVFAGFSTASMLNASHARPALNAWLEQLAILSTMVSAGMLFRTRRRLALLLVVLTALAGTLAVKGLYQHYEEIPARIAAFERNPELSLQQFGTAVGSPEAKLYENRLRDDSPLGYFPLANLYGALLVMLSLASLGMGIDRFRAFLADRRSDKNLSRPGEIDPRVLSATVAILCGLAAIAVLMMTGSRGGAIALFAAVLAAGAIYCFRQPLAKHRRKVLVIVLVLVVLVGATVIAYGLSHDALPSKTLTFRWYYWTASAQIIKQHPWLGTGPENFTSAYLQHRRAAAEESISDPHNFVMHALAEYGIPGGLAYLSLLGGALAGICRPRKEPLPLDDPLDAANGMRLRVSVVLGCVAAATVTTRMIVGGASEHWSLVLLDALLPGALLAGLLAVLIMPAYRLGEAIGAPARIALGCGLAGFVLNETINHALWAPATAGLFWTCMGAALAWSGAPGETHTQTTTDTRQPGRLSAIAVSALAAMLAGFIVLGSMVGHKTINTANMLESISRRNIGAAMFYAQRAAWADRFDAQAAADVANLALMTCPPDNSPAAEKCLSDAMTWAQIAIQRDRANPSHYRRAGAIAWRLAQAGVDGGKNYNDALNLTRQAVALNPMNHRQRIEYARMLLWGGQVEAAREQIAAVRDIDRQLFAESVERLSPEELRDLEQLEQAANG